VLYTPLPLTFRKLAALGATALLAASVSNATAATPLPIKVTTSVTPGWIYFADRLTARVDVLVDTSRVDPNSVVVDAPLGAWEQASGPTASTTIAGGLAHRTETFTLRCITFACLPHGTVVQPFHLPPVAVTVKTTAGASLTVRRPWPAIDVAGRFLPPTTGAVRPELGLETGAPGLTFRVDPSTLTLALFALAGLLVAASLALGTVELKRFVAVRGQSLDDRPPLVRALALVRQAQGRGVDDRRRAVALLARVLPRPERESAAAAEIAWSRPEPSSDQLGELAKTIESKIRSRR